MADPLSVAASIVGLLTLAVKVSQTVRCLARSARNAPKDFEKVALEVDDFRNILSQLQLYVLGVTKPSRSRTSLIMAEQVVATLAACVQTFSGLDTFVSMFDNDEGAGLLDRFRWASKQQELTTIVSRLQMHKSSLALILTILTCQNQTDAEDKVDQLCELVTQTLKQNEQLAQRLKAFDHINVMNDETTKLNLVSESDAKEDANANQQFSTDEATHVSLDFSQTSELARRVRSEGDFQAAPHVLPQTIQRNTYGLAFEEELMRSRPYKRTDLEQSDVFSVTSTAGRTTTWSILTGLSLSELSNVAILALPIYATDIQNEGAYDFNIPLDGPAALERHVPEQLTRIKSPKQNRSLIHWLRNLRHDEKDSKRLQATVETQPRIFGVPLEKSIGLAKVAISLCNSDGESFIYGYIPIVVAKIGVYLKENGLELKDIFAIHGHPARISALERAFNQPPRYGKGLNMYDYTIHDATSLLLRYLKSLPEPIIPENFYEQFVQIPIPPNALKVDENASIDSATYKRVHQKIIYRAQQLVAELPQLNKTLLLYILDILPLFAYKSDLNGMTTRRIVNAFQPALLARKTEEMNEADYQIAANVMVFLVENQDEFLIDTLKPENVDAVTGPEPINTENLNTVFKPDKKEDR